MSGMSSSEVRDIVKCRPSNAMSRLAIVARVTDPKSRNAIRPTMRIDRVPSRATEKRQPKGLSAPKSHSPAPITHLPTGGWTTMLPRVGSWTSVVPEFHITSVTPGLSCISVPNRMSDQPSLT